MRLLVICVLVHYGVQELDLVWVRFICEFIDVVQLSDSCHILFQLGFCACPGHKNVIDESFPAMYFGVG